MTEQTPEPEQQQTNPFVGDEGEFLRALGVEPSMVVAGTVRVDWREGTPYLLFQAIQPAPIARLGMAFLAAAPAEPDTSQPPPPTVAAPEDHRPPLAAVPQPAGDSDAAGADAGKPGPRRKAPARKTTARKRTPAKKAGK